MLAERTGIPVITTLLGISGFPESHPLHLGMPGMHGEVHVNRAIQQADLIIGVGLRFDDRVTGNLAGFARGAKVIHIELDPSEIGKNVAGRRRAGGRRARGALRAARRGRAARLRGVARGDRRLRAAPGRELPRRPLAPGDPRTRSTRRPADAAPSSPTWASTRCGSRSSIRYQRPNTHITSGGLGTMGFAVPAAMGVALARPDEPVWAISGDGGFQMNMQEIATMVQEGIPVKMAVFNNGYLGMVRQWQQFFHGRRYSATPIWSPDYVRLAEAYGIAGRRVECGDQVDDAVARGRRRARAGAGRVHDRAGGERLPDDPARRVALRADRGRGRTAAGARMSEAQAVVGPAGGPAHHAEPRRRAHPAAQSARAQPGRRPHRHARALEVDHHDAVRRAPRPSGPCSSSRR